jgi:hypothetical protein
LREELRVIANLSLGYQRMEGVPQSLARAALAGHGSKKPVIRCRHAEAKARLDGDYVMCACGQTVATARLRVAK